MSSSQTPIPDRLQGAIGARCLCAPASKQPGCWSKQVFDRHFPDGRPNKDCTLVGPAQVTECVSVTLTLELEVAPPKEIARDGEHPLGASWRFMSGEALTLQLMEAGEDHFKTPTL
jgi:hypothetical protein